jgi:hypothetical protein
MKRLLLLIAALILSAGPGLANNQFKGFINEILYNPVGPDSSNQKVEIINSSTSPIVLTNWSLCIQFNYKRFPSGATIPPGGTYLVHLNKVGITTATEFYTGPYVNLNPSADAVGLFHTFSGFGTPGNMEDFVEWGATGQPRENVAISALIWTTGNFVPLGPEGQSIAYNNRTATPPSVLPHLLSDYCYEAPTLLMTNSCSIVGPIVLNEILADPTGPNAGATVVEVFNGGALAVNLNGWQWTTQFTNGAFGSNQTLGAGKYLLIQMNAIGTTNDTTLFTGAGTVDLNPAAGSFALYKNSVDFSNPANLVDFVQWGAPGQANEAEAIAAAQWNTGGFVPVVAEGHSIGYTGAGSQASAWCDQNPPTLRAATGCPPAGCACTAIRINEVLADPKGPETAATRVELINTAGSALDLVNLNLVVGTFHYAVPSSLVVPAGGLVVVHLNESGASTPSDIFTGATLPDLDPAGGSFSLFVDDQNFADPAGMIDFFQWGSAGHAGEDVAAAAGLWTTGTYFPSPIEGASMQWRGTGSGNDVDDFCADQPTLGSVNVCTTSGVPDGEREVRGPLLLQNNPNPVRRRTRIVFDLPREERFVSVIVYSIAGSPVRTLMAGPAAAGVTSLEWDGRDSRGRRLPNGLYFYSLSTSDGTVTRKLSVAR